MMRGLSDSPLLTDLRREITSRGRAALPDLRAALPTVSGDQESEVLDLLRPYADDMVDRVAFLIAATRDRNSEVRASAVQVLGACTVMLKRADVRSACVALLDDPDWKPAVHASGALSDVGDDAKADLEAIVLDENASARCRSGVAMALIIRANEIKLAAEKRWVRDLILRAIRQTRDEDLRAHFEWQVRPLVQIGESTDGAGGANRKPDEARPSK